MFLTTLFSLLVDVYLADICLEQETLTLVLKSSQASAVCPKCTHPATRVRGRYTRTLADLPCQGRAVRVRLEVRRFVCRTRGCPRTTFAKRFPTLTRAYARRTLRQADAPSGGRVCERRAKQVRSWRSASRCPLAAIRSCGSSTARMFPNARPHRCWASTISPGKKATATARCCSTCKRIVRSRCSPLREAATVVGWLRAHRGVKIISRDRAGTYAEAAKRGAPHAKQVADRYHILVNLRDALKGTLARKPESLPEVEAERGEPRSSSQPSTGSPQPSHLPDERRQEDEPAGTAPDQGASAPGARKLTESSQRRQISRANRLVRYEQIIALHREGLSQRMIARHLHVSRKLVRRS